MAPIIFQSEIQAVKSATWQTYSFNKYRIVYWIERKFSMGVMLRALTNLCIN